MKSIFSLFFSKFQSGDATDVGALHEDLIEVMPAVEEANSISEELDKRVKFEIILVAPNKLGDLKGKSFIASSGRTGVAELCAHPIIGRALS